MNNGHIYFEIQADDPRPAINFYSKVFGWNNVIRPDGV
jgi:predicted enzyme related to lactoylglutathione lyase